MSRPLAVGGVGSVLGGVPVSGSSAFTGLVAEREQRACVPYGGEERATAPGAWWVNEAEPGVACRVCGRLGELHLEGDVFACRLHCGC
jgi:hypothetical protein